MPAKFVSRRLFPVPVICELLIVGLILIWFTRRQKAGSVLVTIGTFLLLLLGDSIIQAYYKDVAADLKGKGYVGYLTSSLSVGDPKLPGQVALVLKNYRFDVIHFNNGLHGKGYSEEEYSRYFPQFVKTIEANAHGTKLIWTSSTPVRMGKDMSEFAPFTKRVAARNKIAAAYARKAGIPIDDLYAAVLHHPEYYLGVDGTHPNPEGRAAEAHDVAASVL